MAYRKDTKTRSSFGEMAVEIADKYLNGKSFDVRSYQFKVEQTSEEKYADWFKGKKFKPIGNKLYEAMAKNPKIKQAIKNKDYSTAIKEYIKDKASEKVDDVKKGISD